MAPTLKINIVCEGDGTAHQGYWVEPCSLLFVGMGMCESFRIAERVVVGGKRYRIRRLEAEGMSNSHRLYVGVESTS